MQVWIPESRTPQFLKLQAPHLPKPVKPTLALLELNNHPWLGMARAPSVKGSDPLRALLEKSDKQIWTIQVSPENLPRLPRCRELKPCQDTATILPFPSLQGPVQPTYLPRVLLQIYCSISHPLVTLLFIPHSFSSWTNLCFILWNPFKTTSNPSFKLLSSCLSFGRLSLGYLFFPHPGRVPYLGALPTRHLGLWLPQHP